MSDFRTPQSAFQPEDHSELRREDLDRWGCEPLKTSRSWFTPDVYLIERDGARLVWKDISARPWFARALWARWAMRREVEALRRLSDTGAAPQLVTQLDHSGFIMEYLEANPLPARRLADELGVKFFARLETAVASMHSAGVAHGDLRRRNILITAQREPRIIDFETAVLDGSNPLRRAAFRHACRIDETTVLKIFGRYFPDALTGEQREQLARAPMLLRVGRFFRKRLYRPVSPKVMKARIQRLRGR